MLRLGERYVPFVTLAYNTRTASRPPRFVEAFVATQNSQENTSPRHDGGIACYKIPKLTRLLTKAGATVQVS